jgi:hypothetical protein
MALSPCPECQKDVSDKAPTCPGCGVPLPAMALSAAARRRRLSLLLGAVLAAVVVGGALVVLFRKPDYSRVEQLRAEQDAQGTRKEYVRQRFFRLYKEHPKNAMYTYLWARVLEDPAQQLELAQEGIADDPRFSWNYNMAARAQARLGHVAEAYDYAVKGSALDPGNMQLSDKRQALKAMIDHKLADQGKPAPTAYAAYESKEAFEKGAVRYQGLFHGGIKAPEHADMVAVEKSRLPDHKGPVSEAVRGFVVCANPYADTCLRAYVPTDGGEAKAGWLHATTDVTKLKEGQLVTIAGSVVANARGENIMLADAVTVVTP